MKKQNRSIGSSLNDFLKEQGILEEARTIALKEKIARRRPAWEIGCRLKINNNRVYVIHF